MKCSICGKTEVTLVVPPDKRDYYCLSCIHADLSRDGQLTKEAKHVPAIAAWLQQRGHSIPEAGLTGAKSAGTARVPPPTKGGQAQSRSDERRMGDSLKKLVAFGQNPKDSQAWDEARTALGQLGDISGRLLAGKRQEDVAISSSLTEIYGFAERLRYFPEDKEARDGFQLSLGDVEYRVKRLFGVSIRR